MKAAIRKIYCGPSGLAVQTVADPVPLDHEVLVKVCATTVNRTDCAILRGAPLVMRLLIGLRKPKRLTTGTDFAGVVAAVGSKVQRFSLGDRVWGFCDEGLESHAEYLTIGEHRTISQMPQEIDFVFASASLEAFHYAHNMIKRLPLVNTMTALINGASGAIGSSLLQILKSKGLSVTAVTGTETVDRIRALGANKVIDYRQSNFTDDNERYDFVFDAVGKSTFRASRVLLKPKGVYISTEPGRWCQNVLLSVTTRFGQGPRVMFPIPTDISGSMDYVESLIEKKQFAPLMDRTYTLEEIADAFGYVETGEKIGNVVISYSETDG